LRYRFGRARRSQALEKAFSKAAGVFILLPSNFSPREDFPEERATIASIQAAILAARPAKAVCLSTIGAQAPHSNLLTKLGIMESELSALPMPVAFLRAAWFYENSARDVEMARAEGAIKSFLQPIDQSFPMVATADVGRVAADLLCEEWVGRRIVELEGPRRLSPNDLAACLGEILGKPVQAEAVARENWQELFRAQGTANPMPRMRMLDGFNEGWIEFENGERGSLKGATPIATVLKSLLVKSGETKSGIDYLAQS
jgi:NAD(P)H dehydrogenase (quinone)